MAINSDALRQQLANRVANTSGGYHNSSGGAPPVGGPQGAFDVSNDGVTWHPTVRLRSGLGTAFVTSNGETTITAATLGATEYATQAEFRSSTPPADGVIFRVVSPPGEYRYSSTSGANFPDDGETANTTLKPDSVNLTANGRAFSTSPSAVCPTFAALAGLRSTKVRTVHVQSHTFAGDGGGGDFERRDNTGGTYVGDGWKTVLAGTNAWVRCGSETGPVDVRWAGADPTGVSPSQAAFSTAFASGLPVTFVGTYLFTAPATHTGKVTLIGRGTGSRILCDGTALEITNGTDSIVDNFYLENITAPWIITRDPGDWTAEVYATQSNALGYQPTVNDTDIWSSLTAGQQNQNIGPSVVFSGNASGIRVSRLFGRFLTILMQDTTESTVSDCDFRAGKGGTGGITFWNIDNQVGYKNKAINNRVRYASFSGIAFARNTDGIVSGNRVSSVGESGIKTWQNEIGGTDARCYKMTVTGNQVENCYYDGVDISADYPHTGTKDTGHFVHGNESFGNRNTGFFGDGINNKFTSNHTRSNGLSGALLTYNYSLIESNHAHINNASDAPAGHHDISVVGGNNAIVSNYIEKNGSVDGYAIYATGTNFVSNNKSVGGTMFFGTPGAVTATLVGNEDSSTSALVTTRPMQMRQLESTTPALQVYSESLAFDTTDVTFHPRRHLLANPIAQITGLISVGESGNESGWLQAKVAAGGAMVNGVQIQTRNGKVLMAQPSPNEEISYTWLFNGSFGVWVDEATDKLKFVVRKSDGTNKSGEISLA